MLQVRSRRPALQSEPVAVLIDHLDTLVLLAKCLMELRPPKKSVEREPAFVINRKRLFREARLGESHWSKINPLASARFNHRRAEPRAR